MAPKVPLDIETLEQVFSRRPDIIRGIKEAADTPERIVLFNEIAIYVANDEPAHKRRRVEVATTSQPNGQTAPSQSLNGSAAPVAGSRDGASSTDTAATEEVLLEIKDISVAAPQRKKYDLCFTKNFLYARASGSSVPVQGIVYPWRDIEHAFYLPVPDKNQVQHNYILFPRNSYLPTTKQAPTDQQQQQPTPALEPLVFTIPATAPKPGTISGPSSTAAAAVSDSYTTLFNWALSTSLRSAANPTKIVTADPKLFHSVARQPFRPTEKAVHVKAFRGSKDGYLFFLPTGILWGFKKPLVFLPLERIVALSYTSVLQRTFNIVVEYEGYGAAGQQQAGETGTEEIEFGMLDQEDYGGIDTNYVRRHGLADRSMAEARKAKRELAENAKVKGEKGEDGEDGEGGAGEENGMTELEKAQMEEEQRLQDEEDEDEEDYDPSSDGESEGSGSSSGEDDDDDDDEGGDDDEDEDDLDGDGEGDEEMAG